MPISFYIFLLASFVSLIPAYYDHGETWDAIRSGLGKKREHVQKLAALWAVPVLIIAGTVFLGIESLKSGWQTEQAALDYRRATNNLGQAESQLKAATNALAQAKAGMLPASTIPPSK